MRFRSLLPLLLVVACKNGKPGALAVCQQLEKAKVAADCELTEERGGLVNSAAQRATFTVGGLRGQVLTFKNEADYSATTSAFEGAAVLAGPHRYGNRTALVFVQMNEKVPAARGEATKRVVDGL